MMLALTERLTANYKGVRSERARCRHGKQFQYGVVINSLSTLRCV